MVYLSSAWSLRRKNLKTRAVISTSVVVAHRRHNAWQTSGVHLEMTTGCGITWEGFRQTSLFVWLGTVSGSWLWSVPVDGRHWRQTGGPAQDVCYRGKMACADNGGMFPDGGQAAHGKQWSLDYRSSAHRHHGEHQTLVQYCVKVEPASPTLARHWHNIASTYRVWILVRANAASSQKLNINIGTTEAEYFTNVSDSGTAHVHCWSDVSCLLDWWLLACLGHSRGRHREPVDNIISIILRLHLCSRRLKWSSAILRIKVTNKKMLPFSLPYMTEISVVIRQWT